MCGFLGSIYNTGNIVDFKHSLEFMSNRGPDFSDIVKKGSHIFGHLRLSITDNTPDSNQPFLSPCQRYLLLFNGQIYNYQLLRSKLKSSWPFLTNGDTEVLLSGLIIEGINFLQKCRGPFSFFFYDIIKEEGIFARDRYGEKPFYYSTTGKNFIFGSTFKSVHQYTNLQNNIDHNSLFHYLTYGYTPNDKTLFKAIKKSIPGIVSVIDCKSGITSEILDLNQTYNFHVNFDDIHKKDVISLYEDELLESVKITYPTDIKPIFFLSGGIDSTLVCAAAAKIGLDVNSYFYDFGNVKTKLLVDRISEDLGISVKRFSYQQLSHNAIKEILVEQDEPLGDRSMLFSHQLFKGVSGISKVVLGGDGNDEFSLGYPHYINMNKADKVAHIINLLQKFINFIPSSWIKPSWFENNFIGWVFDTKIPVDNYNRHISPSNICKYSSFFNSKKNSFCTSRSNTIKCNSQLITANKWDIERYLPDDILFKIDRSSMAYSIESRSPFLDPKLAIFTNQFSKKYYNILDAKFLSTSILEKWGLGYVNQLSKQGFVDSSTNAVKNYSNILTKGLDYLPNQIFDIENIFKFLNNKNFDNKVYIRHLFTLSSLGYWFSGVC
jgi:asparagine synthase (glutamine-hydrolysing)